MLGNVWEECKKLRPGHGIELGPYETVDCNEAVSTITQHPDVFSWYQKLRYTSL